MKTKYDPKELEQHWYDFWDKNNYFTPQDEAIKSPYCLMIPPPNVTGHLHMGHAFQNALMDALIRHHRMKSHKTLWQVGTDHAGIATQMVVERNLKKDQQQSRHDLGREKFIEKIWEWKEHSGGKITKQLRRLGASVDWSRERFTMDEGLSNAVQKVFIQLYREGLIYKGKKLVNWDPILHTAVSDLEVISNEEEGFLWYIKYPLESNKNKFLTVATTRPETIFGDVAVAVNPKDQRYEDLIGQNVILPISNKIIPIIQDDYADPEFGTGCLKITPAHDFNDYEVGKRHNLAIINIFDINARLNENSPKKYQNLDRFEARKIIIEDLKNLNLLEKEEKHTLKTPRGDRTNAVIEPYLTDQWFINMESLAKPAIDIVKQGKIKFIPKTWEKTYFEWLNNIQDWCISRQLWWGHRIPAFYDENDNIYVGENEQTVRKFYNLAENIKLTQDEDVLDTWFSSALWPFSTLGWPNNTKEFEEFYPTDVLVTGFDIIFFWVARMIMFALKFTNEIPFKEVYIHGLIYDHLGQKMSKSKGNVIDPIDLIDGISLPDLIKKRTSGLMQPEMAKKIEENTKKEFPNGIPPYGSDALRFTFCALATTNRFIKFDLGRIEGYRNFCNKIWNAARYVFINTENHKIKKPKNLQDFNLADKWIFSLWQKIKEKIEDHIKKYRFDLATQDIYDFIWNDYCDWYLELSKPILQAKTSNENNVNANPSANTNASTNTNANANNAISNANAKTNTKGNVNTNININEKTLINQINTTRYTLITILDEILKILHPFMPFITEEIWQKVKSILELKGELYLINAPYPEPNKIYINDKAENDISFLKKLIIAIRNIRGEMNISPNKPLTAIIVNHSNLQNKFIQNNLELIKTIGKLENIEFLSDKSKAPAFASALVDNLEVLIPIKDLIDPNAESDRLNKELTKIEKELAKTQNKLNNENYLNKAPKDVVAKEKNKLAELLSAKDKIKNNLKNLKDLLK